MHLAPYLQNFTPPRVLKLWRAGVRRYTAAPRPATFLAGRANLPFQIVGGGGLSDPVPHTTPRPYVAHTEGITFHSGRTRAHLPKLCPPPFITYCFPFPASRFAQPPHSRSLPARLPGTLPGIPHPFSLPPLRPAAYFQDPYIPAASSHNLILQDTAIFGSLPSATPSRQTYTTVLVCPVLTTVTNTTLSQQTQLLYDI